MDVRVVRLQFGGPPVCEDGIVEITLCSKRDAEVVAGRGVGWLKLNRLPVRCDRFIHPPLRAERKTEIAVIFGIRGADGYRTPDQIYRHFMPPNLIRDDAEEMQGIRLIWLLSENLTVNRLGVCQSSREMVLRRKFERLLEGMIRHRSAYTIPSWPRTFLRPAGCQQTIHHPLKCHRRLPAGGGAQL